MRTSVKKILKNVLKEIRWALNISLEELYQLKLMLVAYTYYLKMMKMFLRIVYCTIFLKIN